MPTIEVTFDVKPGELEDTIQAAYNEKPPWSLLGISTQPNGRYTLVFEVPRSAPVVKTKKRAGRKKKSR